MARRNRSTALPPDVARHVPDDVEPLLAERLEDGSWAVLAPDGLVVVDADRLHLFRPWSDVDHGDWDAEAHRVRVTWVDGAPDTVLVLVEEHPKQFPLAIRERIDHSVVHVVVEKAPGGGTLRGAIRRNPDGSLFSQVTSSGRVQPGPALDARVAALETTVRAAVGLEP